MFNTADNSVNHVYMWTVKRSTGGTPTDRPARSVIRHVTMCAVDFVLTVRARENFPPSNAKGPENSA